MMEKGQNDDRIAKADILNAHSTLAHEGEQIRASAPDITAPIQDHLAFLEQTARYAGKSAMLAKLTENVIDIDK